MGYVDNEASVVLGVPTWHIHHMRLEPAAEERLNWIAQEYELEEKNLPDGHRATTG